MNHEMNHESQTHNISWLGSGKGFVLLIVLTVIGFLLFTGHRAHVLGFLPYLLLLACPFMHFFMHGGHGKHSGSSGEGHQ